MQVTETILAQQSNIEPSNISKIKETIFNAKNELAAIASFGLNNEADLTISTLVNDYSFGETVGIVVKCTSPLIRSLLWFPTLNNEHTGYIYDTVDALKESIAGEFKHEKLCDKPLWDVIDDVWNKHLHSHLHVAGYFQNPRISYY